MQIVIELSDEDYNSIQDGHIPFSVLEVIKNGVPLPKGHGKLIDADEINHYMLPSEKQDKKTWFVHSEEYRNAVLHFNHAMKLLRDNAPTIIEADKCTYKETGCGSCKRQLDCPIEVEGSESE